MSCSVTTVSTLSTGVALSNQYNIKPTQQYLRCRYVYCVMFCKHLC